MKIFLALLAASTLLLLSSCSDEDRAWQEVKTRNTVSDFEQFIGAYPQSIYKDSATFKIEELSFHEALSKNNLIDYEKYTEQFPTSIFVDSVKNKILELHILQAITSRNIPEIVGLINEYQGNQIIQDFFDIQDNTLKIMSPLSLDNNYITSVRNTGDNKHMLLQLSIPPKSRISSDILDFFKEGQTSAGTIVVQYSIEDHKIAGISHYESGDKGISLSIEKSSDSILPLSSGFIHLEQDLVIKTSEDEFLYSTSDETKLQRIDKTNAYKLVAGSAYLIHLNP